jgi:hypothetical protein
VAAARDNYPRDGMTHSYVASFAEIEVDVETGKYYIVDFLAYADVGTVIHPRALGGQILGRSTLGIGHAIGQKWVFDPHYGEMVSKRFHHNKPPTILDVPVNMQWAALDIPDPETPVGARGIGEPPVGGGLRLHPERALGRSGRRDLSARAGQRRHDPDFTRSGAADATSADGAHLIREETYGSDTRRHAGFRTGSADLDRRRTEASPTTGRTPGSWPAGSTASTGSRIESSGRRCWST